MKKGRILLILLILIVCAIVVLTIVKTIKKDEGEGLAEITPSEEITEEQERQTIISLYYINIETNTLVPEARVIDAKNLLENPYKALTEYLISAPKNEKLKSSMPESVTVKNAELKNNVVILDLSKEFIENRNADEITMAIQAIVNTLTELNEVNSVKILIEGEENKKIEGTDIDLNKAFARQG